MKNDRRLMCVLVILIFTLLNLDIYIGKGFEYQTNLSSEEIPDPNFNFLDDNNGRLSFSYFKNNKLNILDIQNNSQLFINLNKPTGYENWTFNKIKLLHINDTDFLFLILAYNENGNRKGLLLRYTNGNNVFSSSFSLDDNYVYDLFKFKSDFYFYYQIDSNLYIRNINLTSNNLSTVFEYDTKFTNNSLYYINDFSLTENNIFLTLKDFNTPDTNYYDGAILILSKIGNDFIVSNIYSLSSNVISVASLNNTFLAINGTKLIEIDFETNNSVVLYNFDYMLSARKFRALSNQEIFLQIGSELYTYLVVSKTLWRIWEISNSKYDNIDVRDFDVRTKNQEIIIFGKTYQFNQDKYFLISSPGIKDPSNFFSPFIFEKYTYVEPYDYGQNGPYYSDDIGIFFFLFLFLAIIVIVLSLLLIIKSKSSQKLIATNRILCYHCKNKLEEGSVYCSNCGQKQVK